MGIRYGFDGRIILPDSRAGGPKSIAMSNQSG